MCESDVYVCERESDMCVCGWVLIVRFTDIELFCVN